MDNQFFYRPQESSHRNRPMLDVKLVRENPNLVKENLRRRGTLDKVPEVDRLLELDNKWRQFLQETEALRRKRNEITQRSEEHTSELQSPCNLVCRLLLEKKNRK